MSWSGLPEIVERHIMPEPMSGCWLWLAALRSEKTGYGSCWFQKKQYLAHRFVFQCVKGRIPKGKVLDHICRVRRCVNPDHLEPVTQQTNLLRGVGLAAVNAQKTHCPRGHEYSPENLLNLATGERSCRECARVRGAIRSERKRVQRILWDTDP